MSQDNIQRALPRLLAAAKEFNIGQDTLVNFLIDLGFNQDNLKPTSKLSESMYFALQQKFAIDKAQKNRADEIRIPMSENEIEFRKHQYNYYKSHDYIINKIQNCIQNKDLELDLGRCGLNENDFEEGSYLYSLLSNCTHIEVLILANSWYSISEEKIVKSVNDHSLNHLNEIPSCIHFFKKLKTLIICGTEFDEWGIEDIMILNKLDNLTHLDISYNRIERVTQLVQNFLIYLNLSFNTISEISENNKCDNLETLNLSNNSLRTISGVNTFKNLRVLYLNENMFEVLTALYGTPNLEHLSIANNYSLKVEGLAVLHKLKSLDLSNNGIYEVDGLDNLGVLENLYLSGNSLTQLAFLHLPKTPNSLKLIDLSNNGISDLMHFAIEFDALKQLEVLILNDNAIEDLNGIQYLSSLEEIDLRNNLVEDISPLIDLNKLEDVFLAGNPVLENIPETVIDAGWKAIRDRLQLGNLVDFKEVKVLLLGNPNVGKSNLLEYLETDKEPKESNTTHGIQYKRLQKKIGATVHCWDFGGQEYFHATHQLFFSPRSLHLILWSRKDIQRDELNKEECFDISYWLRCVEQLIPYNTNEKVEVIVIENKIDKNDYNTTPLNQLLYVQTYEKLNFNFISLSLKPVKRLIGFKELFKERIQFLCDKHPKQYLAYYKAITSTPENSIEIIDISLTDLPNKVKTAMTVFHNMGLLLYFPDIIPETVFIKPQVLLDLLYKHILGNKAKHQISRLEIERSIDGNEFGISLNEVIKLLNYFDLVFEIPELPNEYFIPQYLSAPPTIISFFEQYQFQKANIIIESDSFLMNIAMLRIFNQYGKYVKGKEKHEYLFWKDGIIIEKDQSLLLIKLNRIKQRIELYSDKQGKNFDIQKEIVRFILGLSKRKNITSNNSNDADNNDEQEINWLSNNFIVFVSIDSIHFVKWETLNWNTQNGIYQIESYTLLNENNQNSTNNKSKVFSVFDFNEYLPTNQKGKMKKLFISYSKEDLRLVNKFQDHLSALKLDGKIASWYCTELTAGSEWDSEIQNHFDDADIICFMISPNFMKTKYIQEHEVKKAFDKKVLHTDLKIVPIILDYCSWRTEKNNLGDFNALPYSAKPVMDFNNQNIAWYIIEQCLRVIIDRNINSEDKTLYTNTNLPSDVLDIYERIKEGKLDNNSL